MSSNGEPKTSAPVALEYDTSPRVAESVELAIPTQGAGVWLRRAVFAMVLIGAFGAFWGTCAAANSESDELWPIALVCPIAGVWCTLILTFPPGSVRLAQIRGLAGGALALYLIHAAVTYVSRGFGGITSHGFFLVPLCVLAWLPAHDRANGVRMRTQHPRDLAVLDWTTSIAGLPVIAIYAVERIMHFSRGGRSGVEPYADAVNHQQIVACTIAAVAFLVCLVLQVQWPRSRHAGWIPPAATLAYCAATAYSMPVVHESIRVPVAAGVWAVICVVVIFLRRMAEARVAGLKEGWGKNWQEGK